MCLFIETWRKGKAIFGLCNFFLGFTQIFGDFTQIFADEKQMSQMK